MIPKIGVLTVRGTDYHPTKRLVEAAAIRGAAVIPINPYDVQPAYQLNRPIIQGNPAVSDVRAVLPRQGAEIKPACLPLIAHYEQMGVCVINGLHSIQLARNKFFMLQAMTRAGLPVPDTLFAASMDGCRQARHHFAPNPAILKPISGRQGTGLHCLRPGDIIPHDIETQLNQGRGILVQTFIPARRRRDIRVFVIGQAVAGAVMLQPPEGDFRTNVHIGGQAEPVTLSTQIADMAVQAAMGMKLEIAGVDFIIEEHGRPLIIEVNSAPGFRAMEKITGNDIAGAIIDYVLSAIRRSE